MDANLKIDVANLDESHRRVLGEVIGVDLTSRHQLYIVVTETPKKPDMESAKKTLAKWAKVYEGLTESEIEEVDRIINTRADLYREFPD